jgi:hypothetical protein
MLGERQKGSVGDKMVYSLMSKDENEIPAFDYSFRLFRSLLSRCKGRGYLKPK